jgi:hypothetical protein
MLYNIQDDWKVAHGVSCGSIESTYIGIVSGVSLRSERKPKRKECSKGSRRPSYALTALETSSVLYKTAQNVIVAKETHTTPS